ncbi:hypothetical protein DS2_05920 [Catenovulum agarivorans DS-2]|uniref:Uncharacterized protein n=1 Tax=Catenovulum agarivorans DS-2 TaxID=1328313 RepID=W7QQ41_9ALTE|nr:hypothetical protein [Catenovulum agarivorans]EWH11082.1 hypothetical protein DS2_05920 [Catenovulum agarivorans DS-2]
MAKNFRLFLSILLLNFVVVETVPSHTKPTGEFEISVSSGSTPVCDHSDNDSFGILLGLAKLNFAQPAKNKLIDLYSFTHKRTYQRPSIRSPPNARFTA